MYKHVPGNYRSLEEGYTAMQKMHNFFLEDVPFRCL